MGESTVTLGVKGSYCADGMGAIVAAARGKSVLNVGAAGNVESYLPGNEDNWLHWRLLRVASGVLGTDVDADAVSHARSHGYDLVIHDCAREPFDRRFDLIVLADVLEHIEEPGPALHNLLRHLAPGGRPLITTPNPHYYALSIKALLGRPMGVFWDHVLSFLPENLQAFCDRHGYRLTALQYFSEPASGAGLSPKHALARLAGRVSPRLSVSFMATIEPGCG